MGRIFGWAGLSALLIAAAVMFPPSAVKAQVTTYGRTSHGNVTDLPTADYAIPIPNLSILSTYDFTSRLPEDFVPFAQNLGFNVQVIGDLTGGSSWSISVYTPGNANPVMEVHSKPGAATGQPAGNQPLRCAWGPHRTATINFGASQTPDALSQGPCQGIYVNVNPTGGVNAPAFSSSDAATVANAAQAAINNLNPQLAQIPGAPQFIFAPPPSPSCTQLNIIPATTTNFKGVLGPTDVAVETNRLVFAGPSKGTTAGFIHLRNDVLINPNIVASGPPLEHELLHALGLGHTGDGTGHPLITSSTDIMSTSGGSADGSRVFLSLTADEIQALTDIYGSNPISLSASERKKFCITANAANKAEGGGGGSPTPTPTPSPTPGSCLLTCPSPFVVEPNSCSCVCGKTANSCLPGFVNADQCQCYSVDSGLVCLGTVCPPGTFPDRTANCQCVQDIGPQGGGFGCDPTKDVDTDPLGAGCP